MSYAGPVVRLDIANFARVLTAQFFGLSGKKKDTVE
jgi:hypothetical protein